MDNKISVFIGSSTESLKIAKIVKRLLEVGGGVECTIWNEGVFEYNKSFLESLSNVSYSYDFGIMIATKDDIALIRKSVKSIPRDNVIFEYGLFLGVMGNLRTFLLQEEGANLPTDLLGYTTPRFDSGFSEEKWEKLLSKIKQVIIEEYSKSIIKILPSTSLAIGYFNSFLKRVGRYVIETQGTLLNKNDCEHSNAKVQIIIPEELSSDIGEKAQIFYRSNGLVGDEIGQSNRPFPIWFHKKQDELIIIDMPTTLNSIRPSVELLIPTSSLGNNKIKYKVERKELENFKRTLEYLISIDDYSKACVEVVWESEF
ncbi:hypothetical protein GCM10011506_29830 [Marivirga lumbricoides]|uniref:CD-NTase-associated protein 12 n=1 Tax=Marivirga lumbricoides TaxID=1046115 RepID=A0ABQ1MKK0_9BACT|nr:hypothetical protein GCM10011506_29830 [Marivirga lumbricoides]